MLALLLAHMGDIGQNLCQEASGAGCTNVGSGNGWGMMGGPGMMGGWGMMGQVNGGWVTGLWWLGGILWFSVWILTVMVLVALFRWLWKKGEK